MAARRRSSLSVRSERIKSPAVSAGATGANGATDGCLEAGLEPRLKRTPAWAGTVAQSAEITNNRLRQTMARPPWAEHELPCLAPLIGIRIGPTDRKIRQSTPIAPVASLKGTTICM